MKNFKRISRAIAALAIAATMAAPMAMNVANAATAGEITFTGEVDSTETHTYTAYRIFDGDAEENGFGAGVSKELKNIKWAMDESKAADFLSALKQDETIGSLFTNCTSAVEVANVLTSFTNDQAKAFAKFAATQTANMVLAGTSSNGKITVEEDGYYVIIESASSDVSAVTPYLLGVYDADTGADISVKSGKPTVVKKVKEDDKYTANDGWGVGYNDVADYTKGEAVPFLLQATLPSDIADYGDYWMKFTDNLGFGFQQPTSFTVSIGTTSTTYTLNGGAYVADQDNNLSAAGVSISVTGDGDTGWVITIEITDVKKIAGVTADTLVKVDYTAVLDGDAVVGKPGNYNDVDLTYDNNPNVAGHGDNQEKTTPKDGVVVFTYDLPIHKYDGIDTTKESFLAGAEFVLKNGNSTDAKYLAKKADGTYVWVDATITPGVDGGKATIAISDSDPNKDTATIVVVTTTDSDVVKISGLDDNSKYYLSELNAPTGYNKLENDIELQINATTLNSQNQDNIGPNADTNEDSEPDGRNGDQLVEVEYKYNQTTSSDAVYVENNSGLSLPGTGGMGTTLFYLGGGALVAVAGIALITKKRMGKDAE